MSSSALLILAVTVSGKHSNASAIAFLLYPSRNSFFIIFSCSFFFSFFREESLILCFRIFLLNG